MEYLVMISFILLAIILTVQSIGSSDQRTVQQFRRRHGKDEFAVIVGLSHVFAPAALDHNPVSFILEVVRGSVMTSTPTNPIP